MDRTLIRHTDVVLGDEFGPLTISQESSTVEQAIAEALTVWAPHAQVVAVRFSPNSTVRRSCRLERPLVRGRVYSACRSDRRHVMLQIEAGDKFTDAVSAIVELKLLAEAR